MMELHSYAKRRTTKKWSVEQKRKLVETRIAYDALFEQNPNQSVLPWKKVVALAKLDDYNVFFVRKQWANMIDKYKQYKHSRLGDMPTKCIDNETLEKITEEWEFFKPIHQYMTWKTNNLHSYALTKQPTLPSNSTDEQFDLKKVEEMEKSPLWDDKTDSNSSNEQPQIFSSDTNEDYAASVGIRNDHDFYSKRTNDTDNYLNENGEENGFNVDASDETQESMLMEMTTTAEETIELNNSKHPNHLEKQLNPPFILQHSNQPNQLNHPNHINQINLIHVDSVLPTDQQNQSKDKSLDNDITMTHCDFIYEKPNQNSSRATTPANKSMNNKAKRCLNERDKYYRHKRRFNRRLEKRFDAILQVFGQIVKSEYPSIDVSPLININDNNFQNRTILNHVKSFAGKLFSSSDEISSSVDDDDDGDDDDEDREADNDEEVEHSNANKAK